jgi:DUF1680 family protein
MKNRDLQLHSRGSRTALSQIAENINFAVFAGAVVLLSLSGLAAAPFPEKTAPAVADWQDFQDPDRVRLTGWLGMRMEANATNRLVRLDPARLLEGYRKRPGRQTWDGEHVGKWLHAATLAWVYTRDPVLRQKLDYVAAELCKCQLEDGYLGTYLEKDRWTFWDAWAHKYNLIGLLTYMRYTGNLAPLPTCRRMADLLCNTFGDQPGQRDLIEAGRHAGMAPTSVLEPMVLLYRFTGELRYLEFCRYILRAWEQPNGPKILSTLLSVGRVDKVGNAKAYEMLSCLNGALEFYRVSGDRPILQACLNAWQDIIKHRLYLTGAASYREFFRGDFDLPNSDNVGETCVTVTWLQFNTQLLRLTGEARFADQLERVILNQLLGAQCGDGSGWGYYVQMEGRKPFSTTLDGHCCLSSGPRGLALVPTFACATDADGVVINLYEPGTANLALRDGTPVMLSTQTRYPANGRICITVLPDLAKSFTLKLRVPDWCRESSLRVNGSACSASPGSDGYAAIRRTWKKGDRVELNLLLEPRVEQGDHKNLGKIAILYGPLVLAADEALLAQTPSSVVLCSPKHTDFLPGFTPQVDPALPLRAIATAGPDLAALNVTPEPASVAFRTRFGAQVFRVNGRTRTATGRFPPGKRLKLLLVPFADAGACGTAYKVWLPVYETQACANLLLEGRSSRSRPGVIIRMRPREKLGNPSEAGVRPGELTGSINDGDFQSAASTYDGKLATEDWYEVNLPESITIATVLFAHGPLFREGGWFDTTGGRPQVQVKASKDDPWQTIAVLTNYPTATATDPAGLQGSERFSCRLAAPVKACAIRVIGKPASGNAPRQSFSTCSELQAK